MAINTDAVQRLYVAYFNRPADPVGLAYWEGKLSSTVAATQAQLTTLAAGFSNSAEYVALYAGQSNAQIINNLYLNLFGRAAEPAGLISWSGKLTAGTETFASIALQLTFSAQGTDATAIANKLSAATTFTAALDTSAEIIGYAGTAAAASGRAYLAPVTNVAATLTTAVAGVANAVAAAVLAGSPAAASGASFTLTTGADNFTGGTGDDTFRGSYNTTDGMSLTSDDTLDGGAGTDLLNATVGTTGIVQATLSNIETVKAMFSAAGSLSLLSGAGVTSVIDNGSTANATFGNIGSASVALTAQNTSFDATFGFTNAALSGSTDNVAITLSNVTAGTALVITPASGTNGAETITITSTGSANTLDSIDDGTSTSLTKLVVKGDQALTLTAITPVTVTTIDAGALTAALTITDTSTAAATITGGSANDSITMSNNVTADSIDAGAGNDTVTFTTAGNFTVADTVKGGDGIDTLGVIAADVTTAGYTAPTTATVSGIEVLKFSTLAAGTYTPSTIDSGIKTITLGLDGANTTSTFNFVAGSNTLNIGTSDTTAAALTAADTFTFDAAGSLGTDSLTINNGNLSTVNALATGIIATTDFETVTINTGSYTTEVAQVLGAVTVTGSVGFTSEETLVLTGANRLTLGIVTADVINASAMTAASGTVLTLVTGTTATTITGSAGNDVLISDVALANHSISGGAGNDTITGGTGNDTLLGGAGNDSITGSTGNDSIDAGAGNDTVNLVTGDITSADTIVGGDNTDTLNYATFVAATDNEASIQQAVSGFETLKVSGAAGAGVDLTLSNYINNAGFTQIQLGTQGATTSGYDFLNVSSSVTTVSVVAATSGTNTFDRLVDSSTNALIVRNSTSGVGLAQTLTAFTALDEETITLTEAAATVAGANDLTIGTLTVNDLTTLNITGASDVIITNAIVGAGDLATVNASTSSGAVTVNATASTVDVTATAGSGIFTFTSGTGADSITGGNGADVLVGGNGADTISGGAAVDNITGGLGKDSLTGGSGADVFNLGSTQASVDTITDYATTSDTINVATNIGAAAVTIITAAAAQAIVTTTEYYISTNGTAANLTTGGTATLTEADMTEATLTNVAAYLTERFTEITAADVAVFAINWTANGNDTTYVYEFIEDAVGTAVIATELVLTGIVQHTATAILVSGDLV